ncbi:macrophage mannose receptor 1-like [Schistocerca serialis cubense]|uniref:macrophage mannose receptor 1-like n=1 Tax=Schistocerca serialis cubense TaxID=2023355 RepID=UPI00214EFD54|nr:macrophage mannose receptor 1-like [Schistocerca serialis cubense]XP_049944040.1 macrophage mannose receptor 1-like [Schistocerca serialis cubense]XP_049944041.1 macrophage mannose receptor 1-like [Schistocerca serialis cubense]
MRLLRVWAVLAAAGHLCLASASASASVDLSCDCRLWRRRDASVSLHCARAAHNGAPMVYCHKAEVPEIPPGYHYLRGYALVKLHRTLKPWSAAKKTCEQEGAQLASPTNRLAFDGLKQMFVKVPGVHWGNLGITDQSDEGVFVGMDGRPVSYIPWKAYQPDNNGGNENCVDINSAGESNDVICENRAPFFCERRLPVPVPDDYEWLQEAGRFYKVHAERLGHAGAASRCRSENARLAVPDTWRRGEALLSLFNLDHDTFQLYLIGFTDEANEGDFVTETGRHLNDMEFQVWDVNEPNNDDNGRPENCLALARRGYYRDVRCDRELPFICEIVPW